MTLVLLTLGFFAFTMLIMAVGVIFKRPCLRGSCGGPEVLNASGESLSCVTCPNRKKRRQQQEAATQGRLPVLG